MLSRGAVVILALLLAVTLVPSAWAPPMTRLLASTAPDAALHIGFLQRVDSLSPFIGISDSAYLLFGLLYDYPFAFDQDGNYVSNLITSASCANANCSIWNYTVRQGVYWSDGTQLTAVDVAFTWNYTSQNLFHLWAYEPYFNQVVLCTTSNRGVCGAQIKVATPWNVTLYFQRPFVAGEDLFAPIVQEAQWSGVTPQQAETTYPNANPIGTGPFIADANIYNEWLQNGAVPLHVYRNAGYHPVGSHVGPTNISDIYLHVYQDPNSLVLALENGDIQLAQLTTAGLDTVKGAPGILTQQGLQAIQEWNEIGISQIDTVAANARLNPARFDTRVRQAMAMATNKDAIIQNFYSGAGVRGDSLISPITPQYWYDPVAGGDNLTFNVQAANANLNQSGYTTWTGGSFGNGYRQATSDIVVSYQTACYQCENPPNVTKTIPAGTVLTFVLGTRPASTNPEEVATANYLVASYAQIGIQLTVKVETTEDALVSDIYNGFLDMYIWYWSSDPDPNYMLSMESSWTLDGWNDNYWNNATYNAYYLKQMGDQDAVTRQSDVKAAEKLYYETAAYIIYIYPYGNWAMRTDTVPGGQQWTGWGNWTQHPYRQMNAYWGANPLWFDLNCPVCSLSNPNQPPAPPVITGSTYVSVRTNTSLAFVATSSDPEANDTLNWTWHWGDGNTTQTSGSAATPTSTANHSWSLPGNYTVTVNVGDGWNPPVGGTAPVYVNVSSPPPVPGGLAGTVTDTFGAPIGDAQVTATPGGYAATTNGTGAYAIPGVLAGTYNVTATAAGFFPHTTTGVVVAWNATTTVDISLAPAYGTLKGQVTSSASGSVLQGASIIATGASGPGAGQQRLVSTDANGDYALNLEVGTYWVNASLAGFGSVSQADVTVVGGLTTTVNFALGPTLSASITAPAIGRPGTAITVAGNVQGAESGNWTLHFDDASTTTGLFSAGTTTPISVSHTYAVQGMYTVRLYATIGTLTRMATTSVLIDGTAPVTTDTLAGTAGNGSWYRSAVSITLAASDASSGVNKTFYRVDGSSWQTYAAPFVVSGDYNHTVDFYSTDLAGNVETTKTLPIRIDTVGPSVIESVAGTRGTNLWYTSSVTLALGAVDSLSGVAVIQYHLDSGGWQNYTTPISLGDGRHNVSFRAIDNAGNQGSTLSIQIRVDTVAPAVVILNPVAEAVVPTAEVQLNWTAEDTGSGVASIQLSVDNGTFSTPSISPTLIGGLADGPHTVTLKVTDQAGNVRMADVSFTVRTASSLGLDPLAIGSIAAVVVVAAVLAVLLLRRRSHGPPKEPGEP